MSKDDPKQKEIESAFDEIRKAGNRMTVEELIEMDKKITARYGIKPKKRCQVCHK